MKMIKNKWLRLGMIVSPLIILLAVLLIMEATGDQKDKTFYHKRVNSVVVKSDDWWKKSIEFYLTDGTTLYFVAPVGNKIMIGDSVAKQAHSFIFNVFRRNENGQYVFYKLYDYKRLN